MLEKSLEKKITKKAKELGFLTCKFTSTSNRGVPDRMFISEKGDVFFIEFKSPRGYLSEIQKHQIEMLRKRHICVYVVDHLEYGITVLNNYIRD